MSIKITQTEDKELLDEILKQLDENDGYCPCSLVKDNTTKCMCKSFREMVNSQTPGECACGRYIITIIDDKKD